MKHPLKWKIYWYATYIYDYHFPLITPLVDKIRDWAYEYEDHRM